jgi:hypothetical protein
MNSKEGCNFFGNGEVKKSEVNTNMHKIWQYQQGTAITCRLQALHIKINSTEPLSAVSHIKVK